MRKNKLLYSDKIFIAGANGMVGSAIHRQLKIKGYGDSQKGGSILTPSRKELNLLCTNDVKEWFEKNKPQIVIDAAAKVGGISANKQYPAEFILENLKIQNNIIENSWRVKAKRLIFLGSSCIYPKFSKQPIKEEYLLDGPLEQTNYAYAIAKIAGIKLCEAIRTQYGFDALSVMPTNLYGPNDNYHQENSHVMAALIKRFSESVKYNKKEVVCWGSGQPMREFLHVDDLALAVIFLLNNWYPEDKNSPKNCDGSNLYHLNVGTGKDISIGDLAKKIANLVGFNGKIIWDITKPDGTPKKQLDINKILKLGWHPSIGLDKGLKITIKDFHENYL